MPELIARLGTRTLVELGAGSAEKSRIILDAMRAAGTAELYVPIDVSATFLPRPPARLRREYPGLLVEPVVADIAEELRPAAAPAQPGADRVPRRHDRELLPAGGDPAARAGCGPRWRRTTAS